MSDEREFEELAAGRVRDSEVVDVDRQEFRFPADDKRIERDVVRHPGGAAVVAHDGHNVLLVRQPRAAIGEHDLLEIPAGRLDKPGEAPLDAAKRELAEEIGRSADRWAELTTLQPSPDVLDSEVHIFLAEELGQAAADSGEDERIEIIEWPLARLDEAIEQAVDAKTLVGLLMLQRRL